MTAITTTLRCSKFKVFRRERYLHKIFHVASHLFLSRDVAQRGPIESRVFVQPRTSLAPASEVVYKMAEDTSGTERGGFLMNLLAEIYSSPLNIFLVGVITFLVYKMLTTKRREYTPPVEPPPELPKLRRDFTRQELRQYDGKGPDGRVLLGVNGKVFDVTRGKRFYGPGGPYAGFAGRDATRGLATFSVTVSEEDESGDYSDLSRMEMDAVRDWESRFQDKYDYVGKLLRPGEQPTAYPEEEQRSQ